MFRLHFETEADWPAPRYQTRKSRLRLLILGGVFLFLALVAFILRLTSSQEEKLKAQLDALYAVSQNICVFALITNLDVTLVRESVPGMKGIDVLVV